MMSRRFLVIAIAISFPLSGVFAINANRRALSRRKIISQKDLLSRCSGGGDGGGASAAKPPPSQVEDIVVNAKLIISPFLKTLSESVNLNAGTIGTALTAGLAVSLAMVPEAVAFSFVAGVSPLTGLWTTVVLGFVAAALGGRAGICSSASGACTVVVASLCASHGPAYLAGTAVLAGVLQVLGGMLRFGKFIRLVPHPVMLGFVNGLALVMTKAQLTHFKSDGKFLTLSSSLGRGTYGIALGTMALCRFIIPALQARIEFMKTVPPTLGSVAIISVLSRLLKLPVSTLADIAGEETFRGGLAVLPKLGLPQAFLEPLKSAPIETFGIIFPYALTMASVGAIESLLTMQLLDGIVDDGKRGSTRKETMGQGWGNIASGLTGGIGGCALLGQSLINVQSGGGVSRLSGMSMAIFLALGIIFCAPLLGQVPIASLAGIMLLVCQSTFSWSSLRVLNKVPRLDAAIIVLVSFITVKDDLAKAVLVGTIASTLGFAWKQSTSISAYISSVPMPVETKTSQNNSNGVWNRGQQQSISTTSWKSYKLRGPLFFGSVQQFMSLFSIKDDPVDVIIDFTDSRVMDHSALEAINDLAGRYGALGKRVHLRRLSSDCAQLLTRINEGATLPPYEIIEADPSTDPVYEVAEDPSLYSDIPVPKLNNR